MPLLLGHWLAYLLIYVSQGLPGLIRSKLGASCLFFYKIKPDLSNWEILSISFFNIFAIFVILIVFIVFGILPFLFLLLLFLFFFFVPLVLFLLRFIFFLHPVSSPDHWIQRTKGRSVILTFTFGLLVVLLGVGVLLFLIVLLSLFLFNLIFDT